MAKHTHRFVEEYTGPVMYGMDRETDLNTIAVTLQKLADDKLLEVLLPRLEQTEMDELFDRMSDLLRRHLSEDEYHALFLKSD